MGNAAIPTILLVVAVTGIVTFAQGFRLVDTVGLLVSGAVAGASIAALAVARRRRR